LKGRTFFIGFNDGDFAGDVDARKSTTWLIFFLAYTPTTWQHMKQRVVAQCNCDSKWCCGLLKC
jgi:hypothetical protein